MVFWTDATLSFGISFQFSNNGFVYSIKQPPFGFDKPDIFFFELLAILSAVHYAASLPHPPPRILILSDSLDCVHAFNSLRVSEPIHNAPLLAVASIVLTSGVDVRVRHVNGVENICADMLSRLLLDEYKIRFPFNRVRTFSPPRELLPARWRALF